ncbi:glycoside hydrolase 131 catalytic N-terminal domain-containing protein [Microdochium nivale]|nr:glycoside hydrolase 131 catalytic N-terminal domain-containing protein [Microdochium nivale]
MALKTFITATIVTLASLASAMPAPRPAAAAVAKAVCPVVLPGQVPLAAKLTDFDTAATSLFNPGFVRGNDTWSKILQFPPPCPAGPGSGVARFDDPAVNKAVEVTINDKSIFQKQFGFRRAGLMFKADSNTAGPGNTGVKTLHWSVRQDPARPLNLTHEYLNVFHESGDFSGNHFNFLAGTLIDQPQVPADTFKFLNRKNEVIFTVPIAKGGEWQSFAITLNYDANTLQIFYSDVQGVPLKAVLPAPVPNDNSGFGQFQIGILKKPTGDTSDVVNKGFQPAGINEGQIYGGLFVEDSANGCVSL